MQVSTWTDGWQLWDLITHLQTCGALSSGALYRGQTDAAWKLVPALYRRPVHLFGGSFSVEERYLLAETRMLNGFFDRALLLLPQFDRGELIDRIIAQHYGVPTQLLDWTIDPFIGLYFAVHGGDLATDCALFYLVPLREIDTRAHVQLPFTDKVAKLRPPIVDDRVRTQKSVFTLQNYGREDRFTPLDDRVLRVSIEGEATHPEDEVERIGKIIIPSGHKQQVLFQLLGLGVDSALMFPGLQGIGQRIADIAHIQSYGGSPYF
jgi:hypothetical protein